MNLKQYINSRFTKQGLKFHCSIVPLFYCSIVLLFHCLLPTAYCQLYQDTTLNDTLISQDTIKKDERKLKSDDAIDAKVIYSCKDSIRFDVEKKKIHLFGNADVSYKDINLKAAYIEFDLDSDLLYAEYMIDTLGKKIGMPVFTDEGKSFTAERLTYNFNTKKGRILQVITQEGEGYIHGDTVKKQANDNIHIKGGKYTTCNLHHPHFYIRATKIKIIPDDKIITGPAYLVVEDLPTPLFIPLGLFPNKKGAKSGIIFPSYGESANLGFFLQNGGYYFAFNDYIHTSLLGDIYSRGSWELTANSVYRKRYKYNGNFNISYSTTKLGEKELPDYKLLNTFFIRWNHTQDPKARPNSRFSADVNAGSSQHNTYHSTQTNDYLSNTFNSSVSYQKTFAGTPFNMSVNLTHAQNTQTRNVKLGIPELSLTMNRIYPFKGKKSLTKTNWYDNIGISYTMNTKNEINTYDSLLSTSTKFTDFQNGVKHTLPISTSFKILKYFNLSPSVNYTERWYLQSIEKNWDALNNVLITDTIQQFKASRDWNFNTSFSTKLYGMYQFKSKRLKAIRHVITPNIGFSFRPDFSRENIGYYKTVQIDTFGNTAQYSIFQNGIYGYPPAGKYEAITFSLTNNLEMKVRNLKDTVSKERKIVLIENLSISASYNLAADSLNLSPIIISGWSKLFKRLDVRFTGRWDPYVLAVDTINNMIITKNINKYEWDVNNRLARFMNSDWIFGLNLDLTPQAFFKQKQEKAEEIKMLNQNPESYVDFTIPFSLRISYNLRYSTNFHYSYSKQPDSISKNFVQTLNFSGDINITPKWKIGFTSGYDFVNKDFSYTSVDIYRDLHCWELRFNWIPFGIRRSYNVDLKVKASILHDLKLSRKRDWYDAYFE